MSKWLTRGGMGEVVRYISSGGDIVSLCEREDLDYVEVMDWIARDPKRRRAYEMALEERKRYMEVRILGELKSMALVDIRKAYDADGNMLPVVEMPGEVAKSVAGVTETVSRAGVRKTTLKMWDKTKAMEMLMKNLGMLRDRVEVTSVTLEDLLTGLPQVREAEYHVKETGDGTHIRESGVTGGEDKDVGVEVEGSGGEVEEVGTSADTDVEAGEGVRQGDEGGEG